MSNLAPRGWWLGTFVLATLSPALQGQAFSRINGTLPNENFGMAARDAGDVNNDGFADFIVGAYHVDTVAGIQVGSATVYSGIDRSVIWSWDGENQKDHFAHAVSGGGDLDNDGFDDVIVTSRLYDYDDGSGTVLTNAGRAYAYSGQSGQVIYVWNGENANDNFGWCVSEAGDADNDGHGDVIISADGFDGNGIDSGRVYLFSGRTGQVLDTWDGELAGHRFGFSVDSAGDVDEDGTVDYLVGAPVSHIGGAYSGRAYVISGGDASVLTVVEGSLGELLGWSVSAAGDFNNDGDLDILTGGIYGGPALSGRAAVFDGKTGALLAEYFGEHGNDQFGFKVSGDGDVNGDGYSDILIGALFNSAQATDGGTCYVYSGRTGMLLGLINHREHFATIGYSATFIGDCDGDGFADLGGGGPGDDYVDDGTFIVMYGRDLFIDAVPRTPKAGSNTTIVTRSDYPGSLTATFATAVNDIPIILLIDFGIINAAGEHSLTIFLHSYLAGTEADITAFSVSPGGAALSSNTTHLRIRP